MGSYHGNGWGKTPRERTLTEQRIRQTLEKWPQSFNAKDREGTVALFASDLVASYPGQPDKNYAEMCKHLTAAFENPDKSFRYDAPLIQEVLVSGDLAVVRLNWTLTMCDLKTMKKAVVKERGIDVLKRQQDGSWKVSISHAYPEPSENEAKPRQPKGGPGSRLRTTDPNGSTRLSSPRYVTTRSLRLHSVRRHQPSEVGVCKPSSMC